MIDRLQTLFYWLNVRSWISAIVLIAAKRDVRGMENVPRHGPLILASNHFNNADPPVLTWAMPRRVVWMAKQELFDNPLIGTLFRLLGLIPVRRFEADLSALRKSLRALKRGQVLGMFPEGTRSAGKGLTAGEPGTAVLALRSGAPIMPVAIWGTEHVKLPRDLLRRTHVSVRIGEPFRLPETRRVTKTQVASGTDEIMRRIAELLPPQYRGVYGEQPAEHAVAVAKKEA